MCRHTAMWWRWPGILPPRDGGVRRRRRHLFVGANCEDDAKGLIEALSGDGRADAETAFRVRRVSYSYMLVALSPTGALADPFQVG